MKATNVSQTVCAINLESGIIAPLAKTKTGPIAQKSAWTVSSSTVYKTGYVIDVEKRTLVPGSPCKHAGRTSTVVLLLMEVTAATAAP